MVFTPSASMSSLAVDVWSGDGPLACVQIAIYVDIGTVVLATTGRRIVLLAQEYRQRLIEEALHACTFDQFVLNRGRDKNAGSGARI